MVPRVGFSLVLVPVLVLSAAAQEPQFTSATVRPSTLAGDERSGARVAEDGGIVATNVTFKRLIDHAYARSGFDRREITGGPDWLDLDRFDVLTTTAGGLVIDDDGFPSRSLLMLQSLLADRFQLRVRVEPQPRPVYALVLTGGGPGPRLVKSSLDCAALMRAFARGEREGRLCGVATYPGRLVANGLMIADLAALLSTHVDRSVIDRTGLRGAYDIDLEGVELTARGPFGPSYRPSETKQSIFDTIQPQLGLRLDHVTAPIDVLVVESAERPSRH